MRVASCQRSAISYQWLTHAARPSRLRADAAGRLAASRNPALSNAPFTVVSSQLSVFKAQWAASEIRISIPQSTIRNPQSRALTLIELLAVVTLIGVAIGVVTLRLDGFTESGRLRAATAQLEALVNLLRTEAMTSGHAVVLRYTRDQGTIAVLRPTVRGDEIVWVRTPGVELPGAVRITRVTIGDDEATDAAQWEHLDVRIDSDGLLDPHRVTLMLPGGRHVVVAIDPVTGEATAHEPSDNQPEPTP